MGEEKKMHRYLIALVGDEGIPEDPLELRRTLAIYYSNAFFRRHSGWVFHRKTFFNQRHWPGTNH